MDPYDTNTTHYMDPYGTNITDYIDPCSTNTTHYIDPFDANTTHYIDPYDRNTNTPRSHRCQWSSTEDQRGRGLSTTPTLRPVEQSEQCGWKESSLERAGQNPGRSRLEWRPDHRAGIHWSTFRTEQGYSSWSWQGQILRHKNLSVHSKS